MLLLDLDDLLLSKTERMESRALPVEEARDDVGDCVCCFGAVMKAAVEIGAANSNAAVAEESFIMILCTRSQRL